MFNDIINVNQTVLENYCYVNSDQTIYGVMLNKKTICCVDTKQRKKYNIKKIFAVVWNIGFYSSGGLVLEGRSS